jgi:hypothetical protein
MAGVVRWEGSLRLHRGTGGFCSIFTFIFGYVVILNCCSVDFMPAIYPCLKGPEDVKKNYEFPADFCDFVQYGCLRYFR